MSVVTSACLNKATCTVAAQNSVFGNPCVPSRKRLYIQAVCNRVCATAMAENDVATISCPSGTLVRSINFASYGTPIGSCGSFSKGSCDSSNSMSVVADACLNKASCSVSAQNSVFGDPCVGTPKRMYIQASCGVPSLVCVMMYEDNVATITCPSGTFVGAIDFASYGTPTGPCGAFSKGSCDSSNSMSVVTNACLNKAMCTVYAHNSVFGDPCVGTPKRLYIAAVCNLVCATAMAENDVATISCPSGTLVRTLNFASYGTPTGSCGSFSKGSCDSSSSMSVVADACLNKASCSVSAQYTVFGGDPCFGTPKRLYIQATCN